MLYISPLCSLIEELSVWKSFVKWFQSNSLLTHTVSWEQRQWHPIPVLLPGKSHGRRSLVQWHYFVVSVHFEVLGVMTLICEFGTCVHSHFSYVRLFVILWTVACQAPLSMGFPRQEYWRELSCPPPGDLPDPGIKPEFLMSPALAGGFSITSTTCCCCC